MYWTMKVTSPLYQVFSVLIVLFISFFLMQLTLAIIATKFQEAQSGKKVDDDANEIPESLNFVKAKEWGLYVSSRERY